MKILALETASDACSCAIYVDGNVFERFTLRPKQHAQSLLADIDQMLREANVDKRELDAIAFGRGPGAFTGLRIAVSVAQGIAYGLRCPVVPVSCLAALAYGVYREFNTKHIIAAVDARMNEIYTARYDSTDENTWWQAQELLLAVGNAAPPGDFSGVLVGTGAGGYLASVGQDSSRFRVIANRFARAEDIALLGAQAFAQGLHRSAFDAQPIYLRDKVIQN